MIQSLRVDFSLSSRSCQSGLTSSALVEVLPRAREASLPANTGARQVLAMSQQEDVVCLDQRGTRQAVKLTVVGASRLVRLVACYVVDDTLDGNIALSAIST